MTTGAGSEDFCLPAGFYFSALCAGIKVSGRPDLALVEADPGTTAAALFTRNLVVAAPVVLGRAALAESRGRVRALIVNSGNANCATGSSGIKAGELICDETSRLLGVHKAAVIPSSTGIIGVPLPVEKILGKLPQLISARKSSEEAARKFAEAILTTDTRSKIACASFAKGKRTVNLLGIAKGSGMIHPQLATMLVYLFTDIGANPAELKRALQTACAETFECISVDGDTSTNDTVLLMASGKSEIRLQQAQRPFMRALSTVCQSLAEQIVRDGEGMQHMIRLSVEQGKTRDETLQVARAIAHSLLVKTAWAGADPNWGRILAAAGRSGVALNPGKINIYIGDQMVCLGGVAHAFDEQRAHQHLSQPTCDVRVLLGSGRVSTVFITTDLTAEYVRINADYST